MSVERTERTELHCLTCKAPMVGKAIGELGFIECPTCDAAWMAEADLLALWNKAKPNLAVAELKVEDDSSPKRPCPHCKNEMGIAWLNLIQVDLCPQHGVWLDPGELDAAAIGHEKADEARDDEAEAKRRTTAQRAALLKLLRSSSKVD